MEATHNALTKLSALFAQWFDHRAALISSAVPDW